MIKRPSLSVIVEFYSPERGGRFVLPDLTSGHYRPHVVVNGDPQQLYLGVNFSQGPEHYAHGNEVKAHMMPLYDGVDYSPLKPGVSFMIREGRNSVGEGLVLSANT